MRGGYWWIEFTCRQKGCKGQGVENVTFSFTNQLIQSASPFQRLYFVQGQISQSGLSTKSNKPPYNFANQNKVTSQSDMPHVPFVTGFQLISA